LNPSIPHITDDLLVKYLLQETSSTENDRVMQWVNANAENRKYFEDFSFIWNQSKQLETATTVDEDAAWLRFKTRTEKEVQPTPIRKLPWLRIAAALVVLVGIGLLASKFFAAKPNHPTYTMLLVATQKERKSDTLPDASIVVLNKNSSISYPSAFADKERKLTLKGEAFFNISPNKEKPFVITINDVTVRVVGTSFNIKNTNGTTEVIVETGIVQVFRNNKMVQLQANEKLIVHTPDTSLQKIQQTDKLYQYYRTNAFVCDATPLWKVVEVLREAYAADIVIENKALQSLPLTTTFNDASLDTILTIIEQTFTVTVVKRGDKIIIK
jgi:transmembrane sensor